MGWGKVWEEISELNKQAKKEIEDVTGLRKLYEQDWSGIDLGTGDHAVETTFEDGQIKHRVIPNSELYKNMPPTHDPYTNPNATIYYECGCGAILDPQTKSFAALNNYASEKGWKIRFGVDSYVPYCVKCGENVE